MYYAHSANAEGHRQPLVEHLRNVAELAACFAAPFGAAEEARLIGWLHDVGKYGDLFQARLRGEERGIDHWSSGAWIALRDCRSVLGAMVVQGHHIGLQQLDEDSLRELDPAALAKRHPLGLRLSAAMPDALLARLTEDGIARPSAPSAERTASSLGQPASAMLDTRMLFSALTDADCADTQAHFDGVGIEPPSYSADCDALHAEEALSIVRDHIARLIRGSRSADVINAVRADLLEACLKAAAEPQRLWTLSAPTGSGKTLAMLAFALQHAIAHGCRRIVYVVPYLSIIEQTARIYRQALCSRFGDAYVREHHSLAMARANPEPTAQGELDGTDSGHRRSRAIAANWDAPVIITTSVQLLESLFSNRPGACRKLHRLAGSVVLFDEVQTIPDHLAVPTLAALAWLSERYDTTVVFSTATQPAFTHFDHLVRSLGAAGWQPREAAPASLRLFPRARRTCVRWPDLDRPTSWEQIANEMAGLDQALCVTNVKRHARDLACRLQDLGAAHTYHLSTAMCPWHRRAVLRLVRWRLRRGLPCRLISTQCIEAGVDIDFPVVYRALGPLEAIAQAAGRCNRDGNLPSGEVRVFVPEDADDGTSVPSVVYRQAMGVTRFLLRARGPKRMDLDDPSLFEDYYRQFYAIARPDRKRPELWDAIRRLDFAAVSDLYRLIEQDAINILVPYRTSTYQRLDEQARENGLSANWIRTAQPYTVAVYRPRPDDPVWLCLVPVPITRSLASDEWFVYTAPGDYSRLLGLLPRNAPPVWLV